MLHTDTTSLLSTMELRYQQAIKSNEPFSVLKKHYSELKQVRKAAAANSPASKGTPVNS